MSSLIVRVNPIACDGHGICAELLPERISLDEWGYPIIEAGPVPRTLEKHARRAIAGCPMRALIAERSTAGRGASTPGGRPS